MCPCNLIVSLDVEINSGVFGQFWNVLLLFSDAMLSIRSFFTVLFSFLDCWFPVSIELIKSLN